MDTFDEWSLDSTVGCIMQHRDRLLELGVTWETFRRPSDEVAQDLLASGFPSTATPSVIAARDVVHVCKRELDRHESRLATPLAVFWDMENVHMPVDSAASQVVETIKQRLRHFGTMTQFRAYCSVTQTLGANEQRRSDLQLSGVHIVDTPHYNRKEVADKMIIVDAMEFAYEHPDGAAICIITADTDFAYLLARMQRRPESWRTILISKGTVRTMLHTNADVNLRWETDILRGTTPAVAAAAPRPAAAAMRATNGTTVREQQQQQQQVTARPVPAALTAELVQAAPATPAGAAAATPSAASGMSGTTVAVVQQHLDDQHGRHDNSAAAADDDDDDDLGGLGERAESDLLTLTAEEQETDDLVMVTAAVNRVMQREGRPDVLKCAVGILLREGNPVRFPDRDAVRKVLARAVDPRGGVLEESGTGATKRVRLVDDTRGLGLLEEETDRLRIEPVAAMAPPRILTIVALKPYVFHCANVPPSSVRAIEQSACDHGCNFFVNAPSCWVLCPSFLAASRLAASHPMLYQDPNVVFFDFRKLPRGLLTRREPAGDESEVRQAADGIVSALAASPNRQAHWAGVASQLSQWSSDVRNAALERLVAAQLVTKGTRMAGTTAHIVLSLTS